jgi:hypothetical protein
MSEVKTSKLSPRTGSGTVTLGTSGDTFDVPSGVTFDVTGATVTGLSTETMGPSFFAYLSADWTIPSEETWGEIPFDTEVFDSDGCYNTSTYRFTPTTAGKYFVYSNVVIEASSQGILYRAGVQIRKNGSEHQISMIDFRNYHVTTATIPATWTVDMNGSSDYLSMYAFYDNSSGDSHVNRSNQGYSGWGAFKIGNT